MKYIVLLGDGMSDYPLEALQGKTPLMVSQTPNMDFLVKNGILGRVRTIPEGLAPGSDVANLAVLGYDPKRFYSGRAPLEAASLRVPIGSEDVAFRCNLVTLQQRGGRTVMEDFSAGHISSHDAHQLIRSIQGELGSESISFYPGVSYRHLVIWRGGSSAMETTPPHDITGKEIAPYLPRGEGAEKIIQLMEESKRILDNHATNKLRAQKGEKPATSIWLWGQGKPVKISSFEEKYSCPGAVISAVDLIKGIGILVGLESIDVPGATGFLDTNYQGKAEYALKALGNKDFVYVHVEAPDEAAHAGSIQSKIQAIEDFDQKVVGTVLAGVKQFSAFRIMVLPDHATPIQLKTHASDPVPFVIYPPLAGIEENNFQTFDEESAGRSALFFSQGYKLMDFFISGKLNQQNLL